ncbi:uncharacterized protein LOC135089858 [Scylla paramamosain]|uniref:uncharacterized protein LOC135089858 n=1 Tax=Scylla paramamosain TaxID=85552 RepID=UPI0030834777
MASTSGPNSYDLNDPSSVPYHIATMNLAPGEHPSLLTRRMGQASSSVAPLVVKIPSSASRSPVILTPKRVKRNSAPNTPTTPVSAPPVMPAARHKISCPSPIMRVIFEDWNKNHPTHHTAFYRIQDPQLNQPKTQGSVIMYCVSGHISSQSAGISPCKCLRERIEANTKPGGGVIEWACSGESPHTTTCFP